MHIQPIYDGNVCETNRYNHLIHLNSIYTKYYRSIVILYMGFSQANPCKDATVLSSHSFCCCNSPSNQICVNGILLCEAHKAFLITQYAPDYLAHFIAICSIEDTCIVSVYQYAFIGHHSSITVIIIKSTSKSDAINDKIDSVMAQLWNGLYSWRNNSSLPSSWIIWYQTNIQYRDRGAAHSAGQRERNEMEIGWKRELGTRTELSDQMTKLFNILHVCARVLASSSRIVVWKCVICRPCMCEEYRYVWNRQTHAHLNYEHEHICHTKLKHNFWQFSAQKRWVHFVYKNKCIDVFMRTLPPISLFLAPHRCVCVLVLVLML